MRKLVLALLGLSLGGLLFSLVTNHWISRSSDPNGLVQPARMGLTSIEYRSVDHSMQTLTVANSVDELLRVKEELRSYGLDDMVDVERVRTYQIHAIVTLVVALALAGCILLVMFLVYRNGRHAAYAGLVLSLLAVAAIFCASLLVGTQVNVSLGPGFYALVIGAVAAFAAGTLVSLRREL